MFRLLFYLVIFYLIWKLIEPLLRNLFNAHPDVKGTGRQKRVDVNHDDIEDAEFKEIDDNKS